MIIIITIKVSFPICCVDSREWKDNIVYMRHSQLKTVCENRPFTEVSVIV